MIMLTTSLPCITFLLMYYSSQKCTIGDAFPIVSSLQRSQHRCTLGVPYVIRPDSVDFDFDVGQGGVRLAEESAIKISGKVIHKPGNAEPTISELTRYTQVQPVDEKIVLDIMKQTDATILAAGRGNELYKDPGSSTEQVIIHSPADAVRDALMGAKSAMKCDTIVMNFCGGEDAQVLEVLSAIKKMVLDLDVATKTNISFNSISHSIFPKGTSAVTVVAISQSDDVSSDEEPKSNSRTGGIERAIQSGEIYFRDGIFYTLLEEDINPAIA
jgi:hypothetical protein